MDEKVPGQAEALSTFNNVFQFEGGDLLSEVKKTAVALVEPASVVIPCKLSTTDVDVAKVNKWIAELKES